ncbi:MAG TPA: Asp-tRNA(Asn)/Glu-tRNA(Gln) amidotransferase GatCAB subunit B, partial [Pirellulales bacterium]|nr:Asp-tRNA(Asn)/Glu-tRNA(Gln) amidotransferase GatCAB subunit B [Pirellulales bacterium]
EGSLRVDANVNLHLVGEKGEKIATPIVEIKNMNSFRAVERALTYEAARQYDVWQETGQRIGDVPKQTRGWDDTANVTHGQRHKEESSDYRYFPDPDLVPVTVKAEEVELVRGELGELPAQTRSRLENTYGISAYDSDVIVNQGRELVSYFVDVADTVGDGKMASNWVQQDVLRLLKELGTDVEHFPVRPWALADLLKKIKAGEVDTTRGREVFALMVSAGKPLDEAMKELGIEKVDESALVELCKQLVAANPKLVADVKAGKMQAAGAFVGQAKKANPNVNPARVREICLELIAAG